MISSYIFSRKQLLEFLPEISSPDNIFTPSARAIIFKRVLERAKSASAPRSPVELLP
jgi:hypothetical protein